MSTNSVTRKFIIEVRSHFNTPCHDQAWHEFMRQPEVDAVCFAIKDLGAGASYKEIAQVAMDFMKSHEVSSAS